MHDVTFVSRGYVSELFQIETRCLGLLRDESYPSLFSHTRHQST